MQRKLAVPLVVSGSTDSGHAPRMRGVRGFDGDSDDLNTLHKLAENRSRIERLLRDIKFESALEAADDFGAEIDYLKASVQLGLLEIAGELEETQTSEEIFETTAGEA